MADKVKAVIENKLIDLMMTDNVPLWKKPYLFHGYDKAYGTDNPYRGVNVFTTAAARAVHGLESHVWITHSKIEALNGRVWDEKTKKFKKSPNASFQYHFKPGAATHAVPVVCCFEVEDKDPRTGNPILDEDGNPKTHKSFRYYTVYNAADVAGFENLLVDLEPADRILSDVDSKSALELETELLSWYPCPPKVVHNADHAAYSPDLDTIYMPPVSTFSSKEAYLVAFAHELIHSTGHEGRLHRIGCSTDAAIEKDAVDKGKEELIAEIGATLVAAAFGIDEITIENAAAYCKGWFESIDAHPGMLYDAITAADRAYTLATSRRPSVEFSSEPMAV